MERQTLALVIRDAEEVLTDAGVWSPRTDAELLAAHVLGVPRGELARDETVDPEALARIRLLVAKRADRVPVQHLTGHADLAGIEVDLGDGVFVPRPHTRLLLDWGLGVVQDVREPVVVDLCTGSGVLALAVARARPDATVHAVDLDPVALEFAHRNAARRAAAGDTAVYVHRGDVADPGLLAELNGKVDLVLANPPYVAEGTALLPEWSRHHPRHAVFAGDDGLAVIRHVVRRGTLLLRPGGAMAIEHDPPQADALLDLLGQEFTEVETRLDPSGRARYTTGRRG
ncbi:peptide chain release factor N(5)-glutamine methyltransferase [Saccharothrix obliqua]|uniref:peptide chain release factor N(5)-glutamine methyltransferase n=1 Tax=Saccharothrix obliqua TaxID=2861747 RepID=UPI001C5E5776|nr:peptide chain release factor N(5)-glutamine methyltransferase [Saccharothrix obliqua]MBW4721908.1 peptide chain release factor N(5)-glutamine methyltransferase [Saccharothrix obliqua]